MELFVPTQNRSVCPCSINQVHQSTCSLEIRTRSRTAAVFSIITLATLETFYGRESPSSARRRVQPSRPSSIRLTSSSEPCYVRTQARAVDFAVAARTKQPAFVPVKAGGPLMSLPFLIVASRLWATLGVSTSPRGHGVTTLSRTSQDCGPAPPSEYCV